MPTETSVLVLKLKNAQFNAGLDASTKKLNALRRAGSDVEGGLGNAGKAQQNLGKVMNSSNSQLAHTAVLMGGISSAASKMASMGPNSLWTTSGTNIGSVLAGPSTSSMSSAHSTSSMVATTKAATNMAASTANATSKLSLLRGKLTGLGPMFTEAAKSSTLLTMAFKALKNPLILAAIGVWAVYKAVKAFMTQANAAEVSSVRLGAVLKATGYAAGFTARSIQNMATDIQKATGISDEAAIDMMSVLGTFRNVKGGNFKRASGLILDMSKTLKVDLKSAAIQVGKALNDPIQGMSALSRAGITFSDSQKEAIRGMIATNNLIGAQGIMLDELKNQFGGTADAIGKTTTGSLEKLAGGFGDLMEASGELIKFLLPINGIIDGITTAVEGLTKAIKWLIETWENSSVSGALMTLVGLDPLSDFKMNIAAPRRNRKDSETFFKESRFVGDAVAGSVGAARVAGSQDALIIYMNEIAENTRRTASAVETTAQYYTRKGLTPDGLKAKPGVIVPAALAPGMSGPLGGPVWGNVGGIE